MTRPLWLETTSKYLDYGWLLLLVGGIIAPMVIFSTNAYFFGTTLAGAGWSGALWHNLCIGVYNIQTDNSIQKETQQEKQPGALLAKPFASKWKQ